MKQDEQGCNTTSTAGYINPGIEIPEASTRVHGITNAMVEGAPGVKETCVMLTHNICAAWDNGAVLVGMNISYDLTMLESLCKRYGVLSLTERGELGPVADVLVLDRKVDRWRKGGRKLGDLCKIYGVTLNDAHDASADARASIEVLLAILDAHPWLADVAPGQYTPTLANWYQEWATGMSEWLIKKGEEGFSPGRMAWPIHTSN